jgi:hypothetical protein
MANMKFTTEQIKELAQLERDMDSGKQPFVVGIDGQRWAFCKEVMDEFGCVSGQSANHILIAALLECSLATLRALIAIEKAKA